MLAPLLVNLFVWFVVQCNGLLNGPFALIGIQMNMVTPQSKPDVSVSMAMWEVDLHVTSRRAVVNHSGSGPKIRPVSASEYQLLHCEGRWLFASRTVVRCTVSGYGTKAKTSG